jgi:hypothetical protein
MPWQPWFRHSLQPRNERRPLLTSLSHKPQASTEDGGSEGSKEANSLHKAKEVSEAAGSHRSHGNLETSGLYKSNKDHEAAGSHRAQGSIETSGLHKAGASLDGGELQRPQEGVIDTSGLHRTGGSPEELQRSHETSSVTERSVIVAGQESVEKQPG